MKTGNVFSTEKEFELAFGDKFPKKGFLTGGFIEYLTGHPDYSCAKLSNLITNPHCVWRRASDVWREQT